MNGRSIGFVEAALEDVGNAQLLRDAHVFGGSAQREILGFQYVNAAEQDERFFVADVDGGFDGDGGHGLSSYRCFGLCGQVGA